MEDRRKDLLIIMPAYNEAACIGGFLERLEAPEIAGIADILVIDDGSADDTGRIVRERGHELITHVYNMGYGAALLSGYKYAVRRRYQYVIQIDSDGQHDPCNILPLYERLRASDKDGEGPDIVLGSRFLEGGKSFPISRLKKAAITVFRKLIRLTTGKTITDPTTGLQGLGSRALLYYSAYSHFDDKYPDTNMLIQMLLLGYRVEEIPAVMHAREAGTSMHSGLKPAIYMVHMFFSICAVLLQGLALRAEARGRKRMERVCCETEDGGQEICGGKRYASFAEILPDAAERSGPLR